MNRSRIALAALAFGSASLIAPAVASANPWIEANSSGVEVPLDGAAGSVGQQVIISGAGCVNPSPGQPTYMGEFVTLNGDPMSSSSSHVYETSTDEAGTFVWDVTIPTDTTLGRYTSRWYCASGPVTSIDDPAMLWVSPPMWMDVGEEAAPAARASTNLKTSAAKTSTANKTVTAKTTSTVRAGSAPKAAAKTSAPAKSAPITLSSDPNALPALDQVGIRGPQAAKLKAAVDAEYNRDAVGLKLLDRLLGRDPKVHALIEDKLQEQYVDSATEVLGAKKVPAKTRQAYIRRLDAGEIRVNVVEDIALTVKPASWYNAR